MSTREARQPIWSRPEPGARNARFSREKIADAALAIAKDEGMQAVSMRRVASELGAGTMTLYHYVANKRELFELMHDAMMEQLLVPEETLEQGWREALTAIAHASLRAWRGNRWQREEVTHTPVFGPNGLRHFEQSLKAVAGTGLPTDRRMEIVAQVDEYVLGFAEGEQGLSPEGFDEWEAEWHDYLEAVGEYMGRVLEDGDYPHVEEFMGGDDFRAVMQRVVGQYTGDERFDRGLQRLLDGVQAEIDREGAGA